MMKSLGKLAILNAQGNVAMGVATKATITDLCGLDVEGRDKFMCFESFRADNTEVWVVVGCGMILYVAVVDGDTYNKIIEATKEELSGQITEMVESGMV